MITAFAQGFPIATGVIEGACRHLVKDRMDVTGARWSLTGAEAVLRLRALRSSHDFDKYWTFHSMRPASMNEPTGLSTPAASCRLLLLPYQLANVPV